MDNPFSLENQEKQERAFHRALLVRQVSMLLQRAAVIAIVFALGYEVGIAHSISPSDEKLYQQFQKEGATK